jgi:hypothetical protein
MGPRPPRKSTAAAANDNNNNNNNNDTSERESKSVAFMERPRSASGASMPKCNRHSRPLDPPPHDRATAYVYVRMAQDVPSPLRARRRR